jgi:antitoxin MazE
MNARAQLVKWGNSLAVRIPKAAVQSARLQNGDPLSVSVSKDRAIVIRRVRNRYSLDEMVSKITTRNRHDETDWGSSAGDEIW